jgi:AhpD family alkylhydroperoxidase
MEARLDYSEIAPGVMKAMAGLQHYLNTTDLEKTLIELVKVRASQINGCAYCVDMHTKDALALGESYERLYMLVVWHEATCYTERERAALLWTETLTRLPDNTIPDEIYDAVRQQFGEKEIVDLTLAIVLINGWNRFGVSFRDEPGIYQSRHVAQAAQG